MCLAPSAPSAPPPPPPMPAPPPPPPPPPTTVQSKVGTIQTAAKKVVKPMGAAGLKAPLPTITGQSTGLNVPGSNQ